MLKFHGFPEYLPFSPSLKHPYILTIKTGFDSGHLQGTVLSIREGEGRTELKPQIAQIARIEGWDGGPLNRLGSKSLPTRVWKSRGRGRVRRTPNAER